MNSITDSVLAAIQELSPDCKVISSLLVSEIITEFAIEDDQQALSIFDAVRNAGYIIDDDKEYNTTSSDNSGGSSIGSDFNVLSIYMRDIAKYDKLTFAEEQRLAQLAENGDVTAKNKLVESQLKFVVLLAIQMAGNNKELINDYIEEGNLGLMKAVDKFDWRRGFRLSTYTAWWIKQSISSFRYNSSSVKISTAVKQDFYACQKAADILREELGREPTPDEIADKLNFTAYRVHKALSIQNKEVYSLNYPVASNKDGKDMYLEDVVPDTRAAVDPFECLAKKDLHNDLLRLINANLNEKEAKIIKMRFGLTPSGREYNLEEIGKVLGYGGERIRQLEKKAIAKLRNPRRSKCVRDYIDYL